MPRRVFAEGRLALADVPTTVEEALPCESIGLLQNLLSQFEVDRRLLPSLKAALRSLEQAEEHLHACVLLAESISSR